MVDAPVHGLAKYLMELAIVDYTFAHVAPSKLAGKSFKRPNGSTCIHQPFPVQISIKFFLPSSLAHYFFNFPAAALALDAATQTALSPA